MIPFVKVTITAGDTGEQLQAKLIECPDCCGREFFIFMPDQVDHVHFQCVGCGACFCDGCTDDAGKPGPALKPDPDDMERARATKQLWDGGDDLVDLADLR